MTQIHKNKRLKSKKITDSAKGQDCTLRIPGVCNSNPQTTVGAHINGQGMGKKGHDPLISYSCSSCHAWLDANYLDIDISLYSKYELKRAIRDSEQLRGINETYPQLHQKGLIKI